MVLKRIRPAFLADAEFRNVLIDEAHVAMGLNHSNIVQVLDLGSARGLYFLVLELVDGWDLYQLLRRATSSHLPLPLPLCLHVTAEVCRALAFAHARTSQSRRQPVVHRDVSPHNVLVSQEGEVKLTDFGIATAGERRARTAAGIVKGKIGFMSPEQTAGDPLDPRSDLYSLGSTLYLMVTGRRPFEGATDLETMLLNRDGKFPPAVELRPDLPPAVAEILGKALERSPADRYASADAMLADVEIALRTALEPAGQSELKQWLAQLRKKDGALPPTKAARPKGASERELAGEALQLDDIPVEELTTDKVETKAVEEFAPLAATPVRAPPPARAARAPRARRRLNQRWAIGLGAGAGVLVLAGALWAFGVFSGSGAPREPAAPAGDNPGPLGPMTAADAPEPAPAAAGAIAAAPDALSEVAAGDGGPGHSTKPDEAAQERPAARVEMVAVQVLSTPPGAFVSVGRKIYGSTPLHIRFRADTAYDLMLEKDGYSKTLRRLLVTRRRGQVVSVILQKKRKVWPTRDSRHGSSPASAQGEQTAP